jgi:protease stability complex PrcB-like protein
MIPRRSVALIPVLILAGCGGTTMRVAQDDPAEDSGTVALAPAPESPPDSTAVAPPTEAPAPAPVGETVPDSVIAQGYAPYGNAGGDLELRRIGQWTNTGISESRRLVIQDANTWARFWAELGVGERPAIDFSRNLVVAVAAGQRRSGGYEIVVRRVSQANGDLTIEVEETTPGPNCMTTSALTQPVDVVALPTVGARSWSFIEHQEVRGCR